ncbi:MAG: hypothetical protein JW840_09320 [Candidatus Thermoplasmatota archaeon]|nr:hypothetical protein [Candidatus Thermoplasmatota archaeon]
MQTKVLIIFLCMSIFFGTTSAQIYQQAQLNVSTNLIPYEKIIQKGIDCVQTEMNQPNDSLQYLDELEAWFNHHPLITFASRIGTSMTIKFIDDVYIILMEFDLFIIQPALVKDSFTSFIDERYGSGTHKAVLLNAAESMYGHRQCKKIIATLLRFDYSIEYVANHAVDLMYMKNNLSADIVYMNTHAGFFDVDGDHQAESVVIATGEFWTNETEETYAFDYENKFIVKGMVGDQAFVAFTPAFIEHYYSEAGLPDSLVFMATCYALYDSSMAEQFCNVGAAVYMGWSQNTVFWTNSRTSVTAFHLLSCGLSVQQVCRLIRSGGFYNWLLHSKLTYYGDGTYRLP